jgi:enoyl-CoA hydratase/carnithine racemase
MSRISYELEGKVALIGLARPEKRNAFDRTMLEELAKAYTRFEEDEAARCALLFAHGSHFTGGLDLASVGPEVAAGAAAFDAREVDPLDVGPRRRTKPVVAALQGYCFTIGIELALGADVRLAAEDAKFSQLEVRRGFLPFGNATLRFPVVAGWGNAMRWMLTGDTFDAKEALRIGIVQEVVAASELARHSRSGDPCFLPSVARRRGSCGVAASLPQSPCAHANGRRRGGNARVPRATRGDVPRQVASA